MNFRVLLLMLVISGMLNTNPERMMPAIIINIIIYVDLLIVSFLFFYLR